MNDKYTPDVMAGMLAEWTANRGLMHDMPEDKLAELLEMELKGECRKSTMEQIHARYSLVRKNRERDALRRKAKAKADERRARIHA